MQKGGENMETRDSSPDIAIMLKVRADDAGAFEELHRRYQRRVPGFFYGMCGNAQTAADLCQETFLRVWKVRRRYRATGSFAGYLFGIARMVWLESRRTARRAPKPGMDAVQAEAGRWEPADDPARAPDACAARREAAEASFLALKHLPEEQRMVFVMRTLDGLSLEDIAAALDCPVNTVRSREILAIKKVRHLLSSVFATSADRVL